MSRRIALSAIALCCLAGAAQADVLWDQSALDWNANAYPNVIAGAPPFGTTAYAVCDVVVPAGGWTINSISMYFTCFNFDWPGTVEQGRPNVFPKTGALPTGNPNVSPLVPMVPIILNDDTVQQAYYELTAPGLSINLAPGEYWIGITPVAPGGPFGSEIGLASSSTLGAYSPYFSPFNDFGMPPANTWGNVSGNQDAAIKVTGTVPAPSSLALVAIGGVVVARRRR